MTQLLRIVLLAVLLPVLVLLSPPAWAVRTVLRLPLMAEIPGLDPGLAEDSSSIEIIEQLFLGLTDFDDSTSRVVPELATRWTVSRDGLTYTFHLRRALWSDGRPVTAHDIVWAVRRNINPATASPYAYMMYGLKHGEAINSGKIKNIARIGVRAMDARTVAFTLERPAAYFPGVAGMWMMRPLPRHAIEKFGPRWTDPRHIVTNGPYRLVSWKKGNQLVIRKNPTYFDSKRVRIPEIRYMVIPESSTGMAMYENGEIDILGGGYLPVPSPDIIRIKEDRLLSRQFSIAPKLCTYYFGFNTVRPPMDRALVRRAFSAAINRKLLIDKVIRGEQIPATTFTRPPIFGSVSPGEGVGIGYAPDRARRWLAEAGYPDGKGFPEVVLMFNTSENHARVAQAVQQMWRRELKVRVRVSNQEWKVFLQTTRSREGPHIFRMGWCADYPDANNWLMEVFHPTKSVNRVHWQNAEFAALTEKAQVSQEPKQRKRLYRRAEEILTEEEAAIAPIYFYTNVTLTKPYLKVKFAPLGGNHIKDWYFTR